MSRIRFHAASNWTKRIYRSRSKFFMFPILPILKHSSKSTALTDILPSVFVCQVLKTDSMYMSGLAFGVTSENPGRINVVDLPEDADELIDRTNSFIVYKNVANTPCEGDTLIFSMTESGKRTILFAEVLVSFHFQFSLCISIFCQRKLSPRQGEML